MKPVTVEAAIYRYAKVFAWVARHVYFLQCIQRATDALNIYLFFFFFHLVAVGEPQHAVGGTPIYIKAPALEMPF